MVWYGVVWCGVVWCGVGVTWRGLVWPGVVWCVVWCGVACGLGSSRCDLGAASVHVAEVEGEPLDLILCERRRALKDVVVRGPGCPLNRTCRENENGFRGTQAEDVVMTRVSEKPRAVMAK